MANLAASARDPTMPPSALRDTTGKGALGGTARRISHTAHFEDGYLAGDLGTTLLLPEGEKLPEPEPESLQDILDRLENLQFEQRSSQQPNGEVDRIIFETFYGKPEWRHKMAVMTKSPWLRKKILQMLPQGGRGCGSATLGNSYPWRNEALAKKGGALEAADEKLWFSDHNWPKVAVNDRGDYELPGGTKAGRMSDYHYRLLQGPVDKVAYDPIISHTANYSFSKAKRFPGTHDNGELAKAQVQKRGTPGPGSYFKTLPRGVGFPADRGETVVLGANHISPWKGCMGHQLNPVFADLVGEARPKWSFPKARRSGSETMSGHGLQDGGPIKSDRGCLGPGPVYEMYSSMRPSDTRALSLKPKRYKSTPAILKQRCYPVEMPPEEKPEKETSGSLSESMGGTRLRRTAS